MKMKSIAAIATVVCCVGMASSVGAAIIEMTTNGGFETGDFTGWTQFPSPAGSQTITGINPSAGTFAAEIYNATEASASVIKQANLYAGFLTPGQSVTISFDARGSYGIGGVGFAEVFSEIDGGGVSKSEILGNAPFFVNADPSIWTSFSYTTTLGPDVSGGMTLQLAAVNGAVENQTTTIFFDNVSVIGDVVPEPASITLIGLCTGALYFGRRFFAV